MSDQDVSENKQRMARGELYVAFTPELEAERQRCKLALRAFNTAAGYAPRREMVRLWRELTGDNTPLPPELPSAEEDAQQFADDPVIETGVYADYGYNVKIGKRTYINSNSTWIDTCTISVGDRVLFGPRVSLYSGAHVLDPETRNGYHGAEFGKPITIEDDCWIGGNVTILPGVTVGKGSTVGAGSVVTKDVPPFHVVAGNPARIIRKIKTNMDPEQNVAEHEKDKVGAEEPMAKITSDKPLLDS